MTGPFLAGLTTAGTAPKPTFTTALGSAKSPSAPRRGSRTGSRLTPLTTPSKRRRPTDWFQYALSNIKYNVGATAPRVRHRVASAGR